MTDAQIIGNRYRIQEEIGQGGMGTVFKGVDIQSNQPVAIKLLKSEAVTHNPDMIERFRREADALQKLNHPNIVKVLATIEEDKKYYIVMEYLPNDLQQVIEEHGALPIKQVLKIAIELADALTRAHYLKIIHRDLKPANVLIAPDGTPRLTDFGVAHIGTADRVTGTGMIVGTPDYLSPEALNGEEIDARSDIWAFGVMLFEMLAGKRPFEGENFTQVLVAIATAQVPSLDEVRPDLPDAVVDLVNRMMTKDRDMRIPSIRIVGAELEALMHQDDFDITQYVLSSDVTEGRFLTPTPRSTIRASQIQSKHNLPRFATPFIGRETELEEVKSTLAAPDAQLVTVTGIGGIGKTRLAVAVAESIIGDYGDGVFYVPLAAVSQTEFLLSTIAEHIGFTFGGTADPLEQLLDYLREKSLLMLLDNVENIDESAEVISAVIKDAPQVKIMAVSRERLRLHAEHVFNLQGMDYPRSTDIEEVAAHPAVQLFIQSAQRVDPNFEVDEETAPYLGRICSLVQGMPLGIELAAVWLEMLAIDEIVQEIEQSFDFLETDMRDVSERHRSLRAVFESSWNLMTEDERDIFMKLSVFRGGFTREAVQKVTGASLRHLTALMNKSLLRRSLDSRYEQDGLLHQYAQEQFEELHDDRTSIQKAHADYFANMLTKLESSFDSKREKNAIEAIATELENIITAWHWLIENNAVDTLDQMLHPLTLFFLARNTPHEGLTLFNALLEVVSADQALHHRTQLRRALLIEQIGNYDEMWKLSQTSLNYFKEQDNKLESCYALNVMGIARMMQGDYAEAKTYAEQALNHAQELNIDAHRLATMGTLGYIEFLLGNYEEAQRIYAEVDEIGGDHSPLSHAAHKNNLGEILHTIGDYAGATRLYEEAAAIYKTYNNRWGRVKALNNLAGIAFRLGNFEDAVKRFQDSYKIIQDIGDRVQMGHSLSAQGNAAYFGGNYREARKLYEKSLALRKETNSKRGTADSLGDLGDASFAAGDLDEARRLHQESMTIRREIGDQQGISFSLLGLGLALGAAGNYDDALERLQNAHDISRELKNDSMIAQTMNALGDLEYRRDDHQAALKAYQEGLSIAQGLGAVLIMMWSLAGIAAIKLAAGQKEEAFTLVSLVLGYHFNFPFTKDKAQAIHDDLKAELPDATLKTLEAQLENTDLDRVVSGLLSE